MMESLQLLLFIAMIDIVWSSINMPLFSWDHVPIFIHMCNASGPFTESTIKYLSKFPIVTIEKGQGVNATTEPYSSLYTEDKIIHSCQRIKQLNSSIKCLAYYNSIHDWTYYKLHTILLENPSFWLRDANNNIVLQTADKNFPQPKQGMLIPDYQQKAVQNLIIQECLNLTQTGYIDGCFLDCTDTNTQHLTQYNFTNTQRVDFENGHNAATIGIQTALNKTNKSILVSNAALLDGIIAVMIDFFKPNQESIQLLQNYTANGYVVEVHAANGPDHGEDYHCQNITNSLSAFLIGAGKYSYYGCSQGWYFDNDWNIWHQEYDKPLGEPMGKAILTGDIYKRTFSSGTVVSFNITSNNGTIIWAQ
eukprot:243518_1